MLDISSLRWGFAPVGLLPRALCNYWAAEPLPEWLIHEACLPIGSTYSLLDRTFWSYCRQVSPRTRHFIGFLITSRMKSIKLLRCFESPWPLGLRAAEIPFGVRSINLLGEAGYYKNIDALANATFDDLIKQRGLGWKSLVEIITLIEAVIDVRSQVVEELTRPSDTDNFSGKSSEPSLSAWRKTLSDLLKEPWIDSITEEDPRFRALLPAGHGNLEERIDAILSDPLAAPSDLGPLVAAIPAVVQLVESLNDLPLEDALEQLLADAMGKRHPHLRTLMDRFGWGGNAPKTLQESGDCAGITRERVRQLEAKARSRLPKSNILLPNLDKALEKLEISAPLSTEHAVGLLVESGLTKGPFSIEALLDTAKQFGRDPSVTVASVKGAAMVLRGADERAYRDTRACARRLSAQSGIASVFQVLDSLVALVGLGRRKYHDAVLTEDEVRKNLTSCPGCVFLNEDWFWFPEIHEGRNRLVNITKRILSVASPQDLPTLREGIQRAYRYRAKSNDRYATLTVPPLAAMRIFYRHHPDFTIDDDSVSCATPLDYRQMLGETEAVVVDMMRSVSLGVTDRKTLVSGCIARGLNENTVAVYTSYSPIIEHLGLDLWKLRGVRVDPSAVEAVRQQNNLRPRETRLHSFGWGPEGRLWVAWKLPASTKGLVLGIPGAVKRYVQERTFASVAKSTAAPLGQIVVTDTGTSYGYGPILRHIGADEGDTLLVEFELPTQRALISITDPAFLEDDHNILT